MREQVDYRVAFICSTFLASFLLHASCRFLWRRSTPLASALLLSVGFSYVLGVLCTVVSALTALHLAGDRTPLSWSMVAARAFEAAIILIAWSALYFGIKHYGTVEEQRGRLLESEARAREAQLQAREAQLQALCYQLQPHFLFNTLNAISSLVVSKQPEMATEMIAKLAGLLRNTLSFPEAHVVTLREELAVTEEYLSIEQVRFGPRLSVSRSVSSEAYEARVPRFLLQPIVENAIRHGIARRPSGGEVAIRASTIEGQLRIEVENDRSEGTLPFGEGHGLGLTNTRTRLEKLYGVQGGVTVSTVENNRFLVSIQFPLTTASSIVS
jgi:LytS/YehU family sensor histidine kinase